MSYLFGIDELREKLMILSVLSLSGEEFCKRYKMGSVQYQKVYTSAEYTKITKLITSNYLVEISVKLRNLVDSLNSLGFELEIEGKIRIYNLGACADCISRDKSFRFICNKIIHAESFNLDFIGSKKYHKDMVWWSGNVTVSGTYQTKYWEFFFSVVDWCDEIVKFLDKSENQISSMQNSSRDIQIHG